jgi:acyl-coenzyme A synthetase/AMP-(fatty) acid ligase
MLGMAITAVDSDGKEVPRGEAGELACTKPAPCMPVGFWPLPGFGSEDQVKAARDRYQKAYFPKSDGVWCTLCFRSPVKKRVEVKLINAHARQIMEITSA